ncbi:MAG: anti-sigma factor [Actinomycetota bacterium]|nr:anti-sigma factor [Actinomycetota bacterium]
MTIPPRDPELDSLLGAYALDALDGDERARVDEYVARNPAVMSEIDELRETAAALALAPVDDVAAPPELWARIVAETSDDLAVRRERRSQPWAPIAVAAAVALVVGAGIGVVVSSDEQNANVADAYETAVDDGAREITLANDDGDVAHIALLDNGTGFVRNDGLAELGADEVYQLWALVPTDDPDKPRVISAAVLGSNPTDATFTIAGAPVDQFMITVEDAPGVPTSNGETVAIST